VQYLQAAALLCIGWGLMGAVTWGTIRWIHPKARSIASILVVSAGVTALMWLTVSVSPIADEPKAWDSALGGAVVTAPYWFFLVLASTSILFGPIAFIRFTLPARWKWVSVAIGTVPALIWALGFYVYVVWVFASATLDVCLPPGHVEAGLGCRLMP
jgi:hypothetical protein